MLDAPDPFKIVPKSYAFIFHSILKYRKQVHVILRQFQAEDNLTYLLSKLEYSCWVCPTALRHCWCTKVETRIRPTKVETWSCRKSKIITYNNRTSLLEYLHYIVEICG